MQTEKKTKIQTKLKQVLKTRITKKRSNENFGIQNDGERSPKMSSQSATFFHKSRSESEFKIQMQREEKRNT